jgi:hypothetical protein
MNSRPDDELMRDGGGGSEIQFSNLNGSIYIRKGQ